MRTFLFKKLVRDKILDSMLADQDQSPEYRIMDNEEYLVELKRKLLEEVSELVKATDNELLEEIADIYEILGYLLQSSGHSKDDLEIKIAAKKAKAGGFDNKVYVEYVEVADNHPMVAYFLKQPEKYEEVVG